MSKEVSNELVNCWSSGDLYFPQSTNNLAHIRLSGDRESPQFRRRYLRSKKKKKKAAPSTCCLEVYETKPLLFPCESQPLYEVDRATFGGLSEERPDVRRLRSESHAIHCGHWGISAQLCSVIKFAGRILGLTRTTCLCHNRAGSACEWGTAECTRRTMEAKLIIHWMGKKLKGGQRWHISGMQEERLVRNILKTLFYFILSLKLHLNTV